MSKPIIQVKNLSKCYTINHKDRASYNTLKDDFSNFIKSPFTKRESTEEEFWALKDINFQVNQGEIFGVIGKNGSGKSTLLKILSRIVDPTEGEIKLHGRVASLLEVGTGFHPDLTGRENIFFNGSMLGMSRKEINKKFDDIVEFAEIEKFIDTPVKFYSSGMYVRLAFAVAAHLDPDILILDEVLSVGDAAFQKKSLAKIKSTMEAGTTVLYVSHSMDSVKQLCSRGLLLDSGKIELLGSTDEIVEKYNEKMNSIEPQTKISSVWQNGGDVRNEYFIPNKIYIEDSGKKIVDSETANDVDKWVVIEAEVKEARDDYTIGYQIKTENKSLLYMTFASDFENGKLSKLKIGRVKLRGKIPKNLLNEGKYKISLLGGVYNKFWLFDPEESTPSIEIYVKGGLSDSPMWKNARAGSLAPIVDWEIE